MAVTVRTAYSMPHLHSPDFDLAPKNRYGQDIRWGNSSPVLILSLLEIVEKDSKHVQEAARRLRPGWVKNACAAFEQGVPLSSISESSSGGNCQEERPIVDSLKTKEPPSRRQTSERDEGTSRVRLSKAKSLDSLLTSQVAFSSKRSRVPTPKDLQRHSSFSPSSMNTQKVDLQAIIKKLKSPDARDRSLSKPLASDRLHRNTHMQPKGKTPPEAEQGIPERIEQGSRVCSDCRLQQRESTAPGTLPEKIPDDGHAISIAKLELEKSIVVVPIDVMVSDLSSGHDGVTVSPVPSDRVVHCASSGPPEEPAQPLRAVDLPFVTPLDSEQTSLTELDKDPHQSGNQNFLHGDCAASENSQSYRVESDSNAPDNLSKCQEKQHVGCLPSDTPTTVGEFGGVTEGGEELSVRPKLRSSVATKNLEPSPEEIERLTNGAFSECIIQNDNRPIRVSIKSSSAESRSHLKEGVNDDGRKNVADQSAMDNGVIALHVEGSSYACDRVARNGGEREDVPKNGLGAHSVRLADRWQFPLDKLETFLLVKEAFELGTSLRWGNCQMNFISHRELPVPRERFSNLYSVSPNCCNVKLDSRIDHITDLKEALAKKWSLWNGLIERRKALLKKAKVGLFRYQLLTHPLVYFDVSEGDDSGSESEEDEDCSTFTYFSLIPTYVIAKIFRTLDTRDLAALKCTCTDFHWLINQFDIIGRDRLWDTGAEYRTDPCMHCGRIRDPRGDVSLCRRHPKMYYSYSHIGRRYWTCCNALDRRTVGCQVGLHDNRWTTAQFEPNFICKPWKSRAWFVTANHDLWCDKEHL